MFFFFSYNTFTHSLLSKLRGSQPFLTHFFALLDTVAKWGIKVYCTVPVGTVQSLYLVTVLPQRVDYKNHFARRLWKIASLAKFCQVWQHLSKITFFCPHTLVTKTVGNPCSNLHLLTGRGPLPPPPSLKKIYLKKKFSCGTFLLGFVLPLRGSATSRRDF